MCQVDMYRSIFWTILCFFTYMSIVYRLYISWRYISWRYIESIYNTHICQKNTVSFKNWTYTWSLDTFMDSKLINFQNDLIFWPFWGPEILFFIDFLTILIFRKNIFQKIFFCIFIFYFLVYLRINNPKNWPKIALKRINLLYKGPYFKGP